MNARNMHSFDTALRFESESLTICAAGLCRAANIVGTFGGITAAILLRAVEQLPDCFGELRALTVNFLAPSAYGDVDTVLRAARINRTNHHWTTELRQHGES